MVKLHIPLVVLAIAAGPSMAQKVAIDYDRDFDFGSVETVAYVETDDSNVGNSLTDGRIRSAILRELEEGGLEPVNSDADLYITYHVTTEDETVLNTTSYGYGGYGAGWGRYGRRGRGYGGVGMGGSTTTASTYTEGTLIVDAYEPSEKKMVWRGRGTVTVKDDPQKQSKQFDNILGKMGKKWAKILKKQGP